MRTRRLQQLAATIAVAALLLTITALFRNETCGCAGHGLPFASIALYAAIATAAAALTYAVLRYFPRTSTHD